MSLQTLTATVNEDNPQDAMNILNSTKKAMKQTIEHIQKIVEKKKFKRRDKRKVLKLCNELLKKDKICGGKIFSILKAHIRPRVTAYRD